MIPNLVHSAGNMIISEIISISWFRKITKLNLLHQKLWCLCAEIDMHNEVISRVASYDKTLQFKVAPRLCFNIYVYTLLMLKTLRTWISHYMTHMDMTQQIAVLKDSCKYLNTKFHARIWDEIFSFSTKSHNPLKHCWEYYKLSPCAAL